MPTSTTQAIATKRLGGQREAIDETTRTATFVFSTDSPDRVGDIIDQATWRLDRYMANPQFLWAHRSRELPIGRTVDLKVAGNRLVGKVKFAGPEENPFADTCWEMVKGGFLSAVSVGFLPHRRESYQVEDKRGMKFYDCELLECSLVPIGCNQDCLLTDKDIAGMPMLREQYAGASQDYGDDMKELFSRDELDAVVQRIFGPEGTKSDQSVALDGEVVYDASGELMGMMVGGALKVTRLYQDKLRSRNLGLIGEQAGSKPATTEKKAGDITRNFFLRRRIAAAKRRRVELGV